MKKNGFIEGTIVATLGILIVKIIGVIYVIPFNAIIEIKDGGNNPNNKSTPGMIASREKTVQKEKIITDRGEYNYIRLKF